MSTWTWVLIGLCAAGVVLPLASALVVLRLALRVRSRVNDLQSARLFISLESLELQRVRLQHLAAEAAPLSARTQKAIEELRGSGAAFTPIGEALAATGAEMSSLFQALR